MLKNLFVFLLLTLVYACTSEDPRNWEYNYNDFEREGYSTISIPVKIKTSEVERLLNEKLRGNLLKNTQINNDQLQSDSLRLEKRGEISFKGKGSQFFIQMPVDFFMDGQLKFNLMGGELSQKVLFNIAANLLIATDLQINSDYSINTKSKLTAIQWLENPSVSIGPVKFSVPQLIEKRLMELAPQIMKSLDETLIPSIDLKSPLEIVWQRLQEEKEIVTDLGNIYFQLQPDSLTLNGINTEGDWINLNLTLFTDMDFRLSSAQTDLIPLTQLKLGKSRKHFFDIDLLLFLNYQELNDKAEDLLLGQQFDIKGNKFKVEEIELFGAGDRIGVYTKTKGDIKGKFFFKTKLNYDSLKKEIFLSNMDLLVQEEDLKITIGSMLYQKEMMQFLEDEIKIPLAESIDKLPLILENSIGKKDNFEKISLKFNDFDLKPKTIFVAPLGVFVNVKSKGSAEILVKKLNV